MQLFKSYLIIVTIFVAISLEGQTTFGKIKFKQTNYIDTEKIPAQFAADVPKSVESFMQLTFNKKECLYEADPDKKVEENPNDNTPRMFRRMRERANTVYYKDLSTKTSLEQSKFFGKEFLIADSISGYKWKVSAGEQKSILGYTCMKAMYKDSINNIVVFFAPQIPVSFGPEKYGNLPGMILEVQSAQIHIVATEIFKDEIAIVPPAKGDKKTRKEFEKLRDEKMKEQREMWGNQRSGGERMIIRN
jgi:GLPGLI family protein